MANVSLPPDAKLFAVTRRVTRKNDHGMSYSTSVVVPNRFYIAGVSGLSHRTFCSAARACKIAWEQHDFNQIIAGRKAQGVPHV